MENENSIAMDEDEIPPTKQESGLEHAPGIADDV